MLHARGVNQADIAYMLEENPRRFFAGEVLPERAAN
jgi:phosphotriesterase-related protein